MKTMQSGFINLLSAMLLSGCISNGSADTVLGSTMVGAAVGALGGAALGAPHNYGYGGGYYGYGHYPNRSDMAVTGALAGAAIGATVGLAATAQPTVYPAAPVVEYRVINRYPVVNYTGQTAYGYAYNQASMLRAKESVLQYQLEHCNQYGMTSCNPW